MKIFLSWIVLFLLSNVLFALIEVILKLILFVISQMSVGEVLFWVLLIGGGGGVLSLIIWGSIAGSVGIAEITEKIYPSKKGTRYIVFGTIFVIWYLWCIVWFAQHYAGVTTLVQILAAVVCIIASIAMFVKGYEKLS